MSTWSPLGTGTNAAVNALAVIGTDLYAGDNYSACIGLYYTDNCGNGELDAGETCDPLAPGV